MQYIKEAFETNWIAPLGKNVDEFENEVCKYTNASYSIALNSGTSGIHLAIKYLGVKQNDYVFCSTFTFAATANPILYEKAIPVFIDAEPESWNMSPIALEKAFTWAKKENKMPKAVIVVDLYGQSANYEKLIPICKKYNVPIIEDAAEAIGAKSNGKHCGTFGDIGIFSFNGNKIITTSGGGMAVSNNQEVIKKMKYWATQAREDCVHYEHVDFGYNYRLSNVVAGIGRGQLEVLNNRISAKRIIYKTYLNSLIGMPVSMMPIPSNSEPNYWLSTLAIDEGINLKPMDLVQALEKYNIESRPVWKPMHMQPLYKDAKYFAHGKDISKGLFERGICLPSGSSMTIDEQSKIIDVITFVLEKRVLFKKSI